MIRQTVEAELAELLSEHAGRKLRDGRSVVVRNGYQPERDILTGVGSVPVRIPKVRFKGWQACHLPFCFGVSLCE